ncbi:cytoplasmic Dnase [Marinomonas agarivorans]|nr:cytoplasmic Dnase [Marinomonas agarivorans]
MIDIGVNLTHPSLLDKLEQNITLWQQQGISNIIAIASDLEESQKLQAICQQHNSIYQTIGCHPHQAKTWHTSSNFLCRDLIQNSPTCVAVGETGLDFNRNYSTPEEQITAFESQIQLALEVNLPLYLHEREAEDTLQSLLVNHASQSLASTPLTGVIHCFTGSKESLKRYLDLGLYVGITGWICDERRGQELQEAIQYIPKDRILFETDAPYLTPRTLRPRPKKNHPAYLPHIVEQAAYYAQMSAQELIYHSIENTKKLFRIDVPI